MLSMDEHLLLLVHFSICSIEMVVLDEDLRLMNMIRKDPAHNVSISTYGVIYSHWRDRVNRTHMRHEEAVKILAPMNEVGLDYGLCL